ncbi:MAG: UDP-N-acetylmuramoyl-L-alanyl-D-glutamate--2,6-diaminopimelate ligase [Acidiferrobacterales bacterium]
MAAQTQRARRWRLDQLLADIADVGGVSDCEISGLSLDSRQVGAGDLFLAIPGTALDGRLFIQQALARGAAAVLCERGGDPDLSNLAVPVVHANDLRRKIGLIADRFFGSPSQKLVVIGVTGTNGKTTCAHLLAQALAQVSKPCALIGTLGSGFPGSLNMLLNTTPDPIEVHRLLAHFLAAGARYVCMEVSSHALDQGRIAGVAFDVAVFTNLSRDHLDYHGNMQRYGGAKAELFEVEGLRCAVINQDDQFGRDLLAQLRGKRDTLSFGVEQGDVHAKEVRLMKDGLALRAATPEGEIEITSPLLGRFNAANLLTVLAALLACGVSLETARAGLSGIQPVAGRVERFGGRRDLPLVVVDYAHTPDALGQALSAVREYTPGQLYCVFGCGGDRDRGKRPQMGRVAEELADVVILTDDNPRGEPGDRIVADIAAGMRTKPRVVRDRPRAIQTAIEEAGQDGVVLVAGKGHEEYQYVGDQCLPYSDRRTVQRVLGEPA